MAAACPLKLAVGCPATEAPAELGAGIGKVLGALSPATPIVGSIISAECPKPKCDPGRLSRLL